MLWYVLSAEYYVECSMLSAECCAQVDSAGFSQCKRGWSWCHDWAQDQAWGGHTGWRYAGRWKGPWTEQAQNLQLKRRKLFRVRVSTHCCWCPLLLVSTTAAAVLVSTTAAAVLVSTTAAGAVLATGAAMLVLATAAGSG